MEGRGLGKLFDLISPMENMLMHQDSLWAWFSLLSQLHRAWAAPPVPSQQQEVAAGVEGPSCPCALSLARCSVLMESLLCYPGYVVVGDINALTFEVASKLSAAQL